MTVRRTAVREQLGDFAPAFARINDDVLFGEVRSRTEALGLRDRSIVTVVSLVLRPCRRLARIPLQCCSAIASVLCITTGFGS